MATEEGTESASPLDEVMEDIRRELVRRVAAADRESNRGIYDAPAHEEPVLFDLYLRRLSSLLSPAPLIR